MAPPQGKRKVNKRFMSRVLRPMAVRSVGVKMMLSKRRLPMEAPPAPRVPQLPMDVVAAIYGRVPCFITRRHMTQVFGTSLRREVAPPGAVPAEGPIQLPRPFPWVLFPRPDGPRFSCSIFGCNTHQFRIPADAREVRFFGSFDGGWLFFALDRSRGHTIHSLRTNQRFHLPDTVLVERDGVPQDMVMLGATLSAPPDQDDEPCYAAAITCCQSIDGPTAVIWKMGSQVATVPEMMSFQAEDVIWHWGFHALTNDGVMMVIHVQTLQDGELDCFSWKVQNNPHGGARGEPNVLARYLVKAINNELLMVVRFAEYDVMDQLTSSFRVFRNRSGLDAESGMPYDNWEELHSLNGQIFFVGRCCSRAYEVAKYPGSMEGIYFIEDQRFYDMSWYDDEANMLADDPTREYRCSDNGKFVPGPLIDRLFPQEAPSSYSPPIWFLP